jgi:nucleoid DNA-binding protein
MAKKNAAPTKSQVVSAVAGQTDLSKKQVGAVLDALTGQMKKALAPKALTLPGVCKMAIVRARHEGARGRQPLHGREDDHQGQAGLEEGAYPLPQEPQRDGELTPAIAFSSSRS